MKLLGDEIVINQRKMNQLEHSYDSLKILMDEKINRIELEEFQKAIDQQISKLKQEQH